jgi:hypothetical protein
MTAVVTASFSVYQLDYDCFLVFLHVEQVTAGVMASLFVNLMDNDGCCHSTLSAYQLENDCVLVCLPVEQ